MLAGLLVASVPAEALVDGLVGQVDEQGEPFWRKPPQVGGHQDFGDLVEVQGQGQITDFRLHQVDVLTQQHR